MFLEEHKAEVAFEYIIVLIMMSIALVAGLTTFGLYFKEKSYQISDLMNNGANYDKYWYNSTYFNQGLDAPTYQDLKK